MADKIFLEALKARIEERQRPQKPQKRDAFFREMGENLPIDRNGFERSVAETGSSKEWMHSTLDEARDFLFDGNSVSPRVSPKVINALGGIEAYARMVGADVRKDIDGRTRLMPLQGESNGRLQQREQEFARDFLRSTVTMYRTELAVLRRQNQLHLEPGESAFKNDRQALGVMQTCLAEGRPIPASVAGEEYGSPKSQWLLNMGRSLSKPEQATSMKTVLAEEAAARLREEYEGARSSPQTVEKKAMSPLREMSDSFALGDLVAGSEYQYSQPSQPSRSERANAQRNGLPTLMQTVSQARSDLEKHGISGASCDALSASLTEMQHVISEPHLSHDERQYRAELIDKALEKSLRQFEREMEVVQVKDKGFVAGIVDSIRDAFRSISGKESIADERRRVNSDLSSTIKRELTEIKGALHSESASTLNRDQVDSQTTRLNP